MKKAIALAVCMVLIPFTAFSLEMVTDEEMDNITGQSGVAITIDDVVIHESGSGEVWYQNSWADSSGNTGTTSVGMVDGAAESMMFVNALTQNPAADVDAASPGDYGALGTYNELESLYSAATGNSYTHEASPLTIRVANTQAVEGSAFHDAIGEGLDAVVIGLPTVEIYNQGADAKQILTTSNSNPIDDTRTRYDGTNYNSANTYSFGTLYTGGGSSMAVLGGQVEIAPLGAVKAAKQR